MKPFIKKILLVASLAATLFVAAAIFLIVGKKSFVYKETEVAFGNKVFQVELAETLLQQQRGLSGREFLAEDRGMLFISASRRIQNFWMVGMKFPLDIIWIRGNEVVGIEKNVPPHAGGTPIIYTSPSPADGVLEINAGLADKLGIKEHHIITLSLPVLN